MGTVAVSIFLSMPNFTFNESMQASIGVLRDSGKFASRLDEKRAIWTFKVLCHQDPKYLAYILEEGWEVFKGSEAGAGWTLADGVRRLKRIKVEVGERGWEF